MRKLGRRIGFAGGFGDILDIDNSPFVKFEFNITTGQFGNPDEFFFFIAIIINHLTVTGYINMLNRIIFKPCKQIFSFDLTIPAATVFFYDKGFGVHLKGVQFIRNGIGDKLNTISGNLIDITPQHGISVHFSDSFLFIGIEGIALPL